MPTFINKTLLLSLLCLIFIGQSTASMSMFYSMTSKMVSLQMAKQSLQQSAAQNTNSMANMPNCHHDKIAAESTSLNVDSFETDSFDGNKSGTESCCAQECDCLTTGCATAAAFIASINHAPAHTTPNKILSFKSLISSNTITSLYRPPILS
ncbi:CopL family metal-binding regulatory protein [Colwellia echini]|uniref:CopL family metal-binding regulatory protein n=1 Tax=Colwellia echini TaxID=1982103 RepID=UPI000C6DA80F|nr:CopL family metal-binding regulatory protein [Colwellia echini]